MFHPVVARIADTAIASSLQRARVAGGRTLVNQMTLLCDFGGNIANKYRARRRGTRRARLPTQPLANSRRQSVWWSTYVRAYLPTTRTYS